MGVLVRPFAPAGLERLRAPVADGGTGTALRRRRDEGFAVTRARRVDAEPVGRA